mgnify:CR=1 FL=1
MRLDPKFALSWALLSYVDATRLPSPRLFNQRSPSVKRHGRQPKPHSRLQPNLGEAVLAKGITTTPA